MKKELFEQIMAAQIKRRTLLKGAAGAGALAAGTASGLFSLSGTASAAGNVRSDILKIPGVGVGSPTDSDWQKVGELTLAATKENVKEGEFNGVELTFLGLNNQNLHNFLFRGFLKPWEAYTGARISSSNPSNARGKSSSNARVRV